MINDSVREDLKTKVSTATKSPDFEIKGNFPMSNQIKPPAKLAYPQKPVIAEPGIAVKTETSEIPTAPTSPTLIEFHSKNAAVPQWRLQLQNTVRRRQERSTTEMKKSDSSPVQKTKLVTSGATALKTEPDAKIEEPEITQSGNPTLSSALQRIQQSRQKFLVEQEKPKPVPVKTAPAPNKNYPFYIAGKTKEETPKKAQVNVPPNFTAQPKPAASLKNNNQDFDTNKLPALPTSARISTSFEKRPTNFVEEKKIIGDNKKTEEKVQIKEKVKFEEKKKIENKVIEPEEIINSEATEFEETDDCAPFAMRFNAGLFDLIIGLFATLLLFLPFMLSGGSWFTLAGFTMFLATCAVVMFIYLTMAIGMYGKTFGMRLFSLEVIDIEGENYPTLFQAAVSSFLYIGSLALGGIGFITLFFNEEKRAVHDLVSGTIVVKEF